VSVAYFKRVGIDAAFPRNITKQSSKQIDKNYMTSQEKGRILIIFNIRFFAQM